MSQQTSPQSAEVGQALRDFTVVIIKDKAILGTAFAVSMDGKIVTCAHVVKAVLGKHPRDANESDLITVIFPQLKEKNKREAKVLSYFPEHEDDVIVLQLVDGMMPLAPEQLAILGKGDACEGHQFQSYGFRKGRGNNLLPAYGEIRGEIIEIVLDETTSKCYANELFLESQAIDEGMSGAAVFDVDKNLIVGVISHSYKSESQKDRDASKAVNARVLNLAPFALKLYEGESYPRKAGPRPNLEAPPSAAPKLSDLSRAPSVLDEWVGREELLANVTQLYEDPAERVIGLVGFGGEGKTSLTRKWLQSFMNTYPSIPVFWWPFYENRSSDEFLTAFLRFLGGEKMAEEAKSATQRASYIGDLMMKHDVLLILDGFEVMQHEDGSDFGKVANRDLLDMLKFAALENSKGFCIITTRAPLMDLQPYNTYEHVDITRLSEADGRELLRQTGVQGNDLALTKLVNLWDGHALTLGLLGKYLKEKFDGAIEHLDAVPPPTADEPFYERVKRVLRRYDEHMSEADRAFMKIFSAFRLPVNEKAFIKVFWTDTGSHLNAPLLDLQYTEFTDMVKALLDRGLLRLSLEGEERLSTAHPLIRSHYAQSLEGDTSTHRAIAGYYEGIVVDDGIDMTKFDYVKDLIIKQGFLKEASNTEIVKRVMVDNGYVKIPSLSGLLPSIEIVHHLSKAELYEDAFDVFWYRVYFGRFFSLTKVLGAYETALNILLDFFANGNVEQDPKLKESNHKTFILNDVGYCLQYLGRLSEAIFFYYRSLELARINDDWFGLYVGYINLSVINWQLGELRTGESMAKEAQRFAHQISNAHESQIEEKKAITYLAWSLAQQGQIFEESGALALLNLAQTIQHEKTNFAYLFSDEGIYHAKILMRAKDFLEAQIITKINLNICYQAMAVNDIPICEYILGDIAVYNNEYDTAHKHYDDAIKLALMVDALYPRIEAWIARGLFYAKHMKDGQAALADLEEAMRPILQSGYRLYEVDCRVAFAWAYKHLPNPDLDKAKQEAHHALEMSKEMGYAWGKEDAEEVLKALEVI